MEVDFLVHFSSAKSFSFKCESLDAHSMVYIFFYFSIFFKKKNCTNY